jgi:hypothetical protein
VEKHELLGEQMLRCYIVLLSVVCWIGCSDSKSSETQSDARPVALDASISADMHLLAIDSAVGMATLDLGTIEVDMQTVDHGVVQDLSFESTDMAVEALNDFELVDREVTPAADASEPLVARDSIGQCAVNDDCPASALGAGSCSRALPGGACLGCAGDAQCPGDSECSNFGACVSPCNANAECAPGLICLRTGRCAAQSCIDGLCPDPRFTCSESNQCARASCADDQDCYTGMFCLDRLCVQQVWQ